MGAIENNWLQYKPAIIPYKGKYVDNWFSNMVESPFTAGNLTFNSVEHFYQAMKSENTLEFVLIANAKTPYEAKKLGRRVDKPFEYLIGKNHPLEDNRIITSVEEAKLAVMEMRLIYKFEHIGEWTAKLALSKEERIVEWNNWGDTYWGVDVKTGKGKNHLGLILEKIRKKIKKELDFN